MAKSAIEIGRDRYQIAVEAERDCYDEMAEDVRFEAGDQWPEGIKRMRENDVNGARPCLVINHARKHKNALLNDVRRNRPSIKVLPVDDKADIETAKILNGMIRHISATSDADIATDTAADGQITSGLGFFRIDTEMVNEDLNEQEIRINPIINQFSVHMDPFANHPAGADAGWCFIDVEMSREAFDEEHPDADAGDWDSAQDISMRSWYPSEDVVRVAEYWEVVKVTPSKAWPFAKRVKWRKMTGKSVIEERDLACTMIPVIRVAGEERRYDGKRDYRGIIRDIRDPAQMYNYWSSANTEAVALSPKAPYIAPVEAIEGHEEAWKNANTSNAPYLPYNQFEPNTENRLDKPERAQAMGVNTALVQGMMQSAEDIRQVSGQSQAGFGEVGNEQSGRAINARRSEQDNNTFHFMDNLTRSIKQAGRIVVEMIPFIYDTRRVVRILGEDDAPDFATLDPTVPRAMVEQQDALGKIERIYNPSIGRYDVRVTAGPSYATKAEEGAERLSQIVQAAPQMLAIAGDLLFKAMDIPGSDELAERMKAMLPPELKALEEAKKSGQEQGMQQAEQVRQQMMQQIAPMVEELKAALDAAAAENDALQGAVDEMKQQLTNKQAEYELKAAEIAQKERDSERELQAKMADSEAEVAVAYIGSQSKAPEREDDASESMANTAAAVAAQQAVQMMGDLAQQLTAQIQAIATAAQGAAQAVQEVQETQAQAQEQARAIEARVEAQEAHRAQMAQVAAGLLSGALTEEQAAAQIGRQH